MPATHLFLPAYLTRVTEDLLRAAGTPDAIAASVAHSLVDANLAGHDSHGVLRIPSYLEAIERGSLVPGASPRITHDAGVALCIDGQRGWGHYTARWAMDRAIQRAREQGIAWISLSRCNHIGRLGEYVEQATEHGCIGMATVGNGGPTRGNVAPFNGAARALGTNPLAVGVPTGDDTPFVMDMATSVCAEGKIRVARSKGVPLPPGCIVDNDGNPAVDPEAFYAGGALLPAGEHKGYALSLFMCLLGGLGNPMRDDSGNFGGISLMALDIGRFRPVAEYQAEVRRFLDAIKTTPARPGAEVLAPGDYEQRRRRERTAAGIEVPDTVWSQIGEAAEKLGVSLAE